ncbi:Papd4 [Symbiodinium necroappetens]|uniref:Papd4 protein n=1 Tax=Symbiodinium necroappetens TaxID=1628268 RepID=A0A812Q8P9_9DINO|nr:Papd4 [Symbiodinium necroappetens]
MLSELEAAYHRSAKESDKDKDAVLKTMLADAAAILQQSANFVTPGTPVTIESLAAQLEGPSPPQMILPLGALVESYIETGSRVDALRAVFAQPFLKGIPEDVKASLVEGYEKIPPFFKVLQVDVLKKGGKGWDLTKVEGVWSVLLWADMFLWSLASIAKGRGIPFIKEFTCGGVGDGGVCNFWNSPTWKSFEQWSGAKKGIVPSDLEGEERGRVCIFEGYSLELELQALERKKGTNFGVCDGVDRATEVFAAAMNARDKDFSPEELEGWKEKGQDEEAVSGIPQVRYGLVGAFRIPREVLLKSIDEKDDRVHEEGLKEQPELDPDPEGLGEYEPSAYDSDERPDVALFDDEFDLFEGSIEGARALALEAEDVEELKEYLKGIVVPADQVVLRHCVVFNNADDSYRGNFELSVRSFEEESLKISVLGAQAVSFDPRNIHSVTQGSTWFLAAYTPLGSKKIDPEKKEFLEAHGFGFGFEEMPRVFAVAPEDPEEPGQGSNDICVGVAEPSQVGNLADDEQPDSVTAFIGWDPNRGAPGDAQPLVLEEVDLEEFLKERCVDCELERLGIIGVQEAVDLQFLYVEDLIEEGIPEISARRIMFGIHPEGTVRPDEPSNCALRTGEVRLYDRILSMFHRWNLLYNGVKEDQSTRTFRFNNSPEEVMRQLAKVLRLRRSKEFFRIRTLAWISMPEGSPLTPCERNVWKIVTESGKVVGFMIIYVDDIMLLSSKEEAEKAYAWIREMPEAEEYTQDELRAAQKLTGELLWVAQRKGYVVEGEKAEFNLPFHGGDLTDSLATKRLRVDNLAAIVIAEGGPH